MYISEELDCLESRAGEGWACSETFRSCPLSSASSCRTDRARDDILAREASMSRLLLLLQGETPGNMLVSGAVGDVLVNAKLGRGTDVHVVVSPC